MLNISRLLETPRTKTLASWKAEAGNIHPLACWHPVKVQLRTEQNGTEQSQARSLKRKEKAPLALSLKQEKPRGVMLAVWENVVLFKARTEVN